MGDPIGRDEFTLYAKQQDERHKENLDRFKSIDTKLWGVLLLIIAGYAAGTTMMVLHI